MKFNQYVVLREEDQTQEIDQIFNKAAEDIRALFDQLVKKTEEMSDIYSKATLPEGMKRLIIQDLMKLANKIQRVGLQANESVKDFVSNVASLINEQTPSIVDNLGSHGTGIGGKKAYDFKSVVNNIYSMVMSRMSQLKDAVFQHMGIIRDTQKTVRGLKGTAGQIRNKVDKLLVNQPLTPAEQQSAYDSMIALMGVANSGTKIKLKQGNKEIAVDPKSDIWQQEVMRLGSQNKVFKIVYSELQPDKKEIVKGEKEVNIGDPAEIHQAIKALGLERISNFIPPKKIDRKFKVRES